jgi:acyl carrier protein
MKRVALAFAALVFLGLMVSPLFADCTEEDIHNAVAEWAGVPFESITDETPLDGLGGRSWPEAAPPLIADIEQMCGCTIPPEVYETLEIVEDIDEFVGVDDLYTKPKN